MTLRIIPNTGLYSKPIIFHKVEPITHRKSLTQKITKFNLHRSHPPVIAEPEKINEVIFAEMLKNSKFLHRLLMQRGPIDPIPLLDLINPIDDYTGNYEIAKAKGEIRKRLIAPALLNKDTSTIASPLDFANKFINGVYPSEIVLKPDSSAGGDGVLKLSRDEGSITIKMHNPIGSKLLALLDIYDYAKANSNIKLEGENSSLITLKFETRNIQVAKDILAEIAFRALQTKFPHESERYFAYTDLQSGLVEKDTKLLKLNDKMIEGRYYMFLHNGEFRLVRSRRLDRTPISSYMKIGKNAELVNGGEVESEWPNMHHSLIKALNLDCNQEDFNYYIFNLLRSQAIKSLQNFAELHEEPKLFIDELDYAAFTIDLAWEKDKFMEVPQIANPSKIKVPKPVLMEMSWAFKFKD